MPSLCWRDTSEANTMARSERLTFSNGQGLSLAGALALPADPPRGVALFAHCFTCGKNSLAASRIARALAELGYAVLRFDFTGLGNSEGDFGNTGFAANVDDLVAAADHLRATLEAPALLIGHSLGGTAVLQAAAQIPEAKAVVTIGSPATAEHVVRQFGAAQADAAEPDRMTVSLGGRAFSVARNFAEGFHSAALPDALGGLRKALLVLHAPLDAVVSVDEAGRIFGAARHPKSFVSLDGADHLLTARPDADYVASLIAAWAERYLPAPAVIEAAPVPRGTVRVRELGPGFLTEVRSDDHRWLADEPASVGGRNEGPDPYEHLLAALGTCTSMTLRMYANRKRLPLEGVEIELAHRREHLQDCETCAENDGSRVDVLERRIALIGPLDESQRQSLLAIADRCPVHRTLENDLRIDTALLPTEAQRP
ncbi:MAG: bifunctional alpha/beta hydrolase/OsmC family protein [Pseudomonadota bacterium]